MLVISLVGLAGVRGRLRLLEELFEQQQRTIDELTRRLQDLRKTAAAAPPPAPAPPIVVPMPKPIAPPPPPPVVTPPPAAVVAPPPTEKPAVRATPAPPI